MIQVYGYTKCSTVKKALKFLEDCKVEYNFTDFVSNKLSSEQIKEIHVNSELPIRSLFNTSGILYRELKLKDKIDLMSIQECYDLLATDGMLVKRPILVNDKQVFIGFKPEVWGGLK